MMAAFGGSTPSSSPDTPAASSPKSFVASAASSSGVEDESGTSSPSSEFASALGGAVSEEAKARRLLKSARRAAAQAAFAEAKFGPLHAAAAALSNCTRADLALLCGFLHQRRRERMEECLFESAELSEKGVAEEGGEATDARTLLRRLQAQGLLQRPPPLPDAVTRCATQRLLLHRLLSKFPEKEDRTTGGIGQEKREEETEKSEDTAFGSSLFARLQEPLVKGTSAVEDDLVESKSLAYLRVAIEEAKKRSVDFPRMLPVVPTEEDATAEASDSLGESETQTALFDGETEEMHFMERDAEALDAETQSQKPQSQTPHRQQKRLSSLARIRSKLHAALLQLSTLREAAGEAELLLAEMTLRAEKALALRRALEESSEKGGFCEEEKGKFYFNSSVPSSTASAALLRRDSSSWRVEEGNGGEDSSLERDEECVEDLGSCEGSQGVERLMRRYYEGLLRSLNRRPQTATPSSSCVGGTGSDEKYSALSEETAALSVPTAPSPAAETVFVDPFVSAPILRNPSPRSFLAGLSDASSASPEEQRRALVSTGIHGTSNGGNAAANCSSTLACLAAQQQQQQPHQNTSLNSPSGAAGVEKVKGVAFCRSNRYWMCSKMENGKQQCRYFSVKQLGFESARRQAILLRQQWKGDVSEDVLRTINEEACMTPTEGLGDPSGGGAEDSQSDCPLTPLEEASSSGVTKTKLAQETPMRETSSRVTGGSAFTTGESNAVLELQHSRRAANSGGSAPPKRKRLSSSRHVVVDRSGVIPRPPAEFDFGSDTDFLTENEEDREEESLAMDAAFMARNSAELNSHETCASEASAEGQTGGSSASASEQQRLREIAEKCFLGASTTADATISRYFRCSRFGFRRGYKLSVFTLLLHAPRAAALKAFAAIKLIKRRRREAKLNAQGPRQQDSIARPAEQDGDASVSTPLLSPQSLRLPLSGEASVREASVREASVREASSAAPSFDGDGAVGGSGASPAPAGARLTPDLAVARGFTPGAVASAASEDHQSAGGLDSTSSFEFQESASFGPRHVADAPAAACLGSRTGDATAVSQADFNAIVTRQNELLASFAVAEAAAKRRCLVTPTTRGTHVLADGFDGSGFVDAQHSQQHLDHLQQLHQHMRLCSDGSRQEANGNGFLEGDSRSVGLS